MAHGVDSLRITGTGSQFWIPSNISKILNFQTVF